MKKTIAAVAMAASLAVGGLAGSALGGPTLAGAAETANGAVDWVDEALGGLVDDGTITQEQADSVETALDDARPEHGFGHQGDVHMGLPVVAEALGMTEDELRTALEDDQTIADIAGENGVDVATVVDAIVADQTEHINEAVAAGDLTQEQADEILANAEEHATAMVNGEMPAIRVGPHGGPRGGPHGGPLGGPQGQVGQAPSAGDAAGD